jgi:hypothetical protein
MSMDVRGYKLHNLTCLHYHQIMPSNELDESMNWVQDMKRMSMDPQGQTYNGEIIPSLGLSY